MLAEEQHRDQVAADHEEHLDPEEAARSQLGLPWYTITAITASAQAIQPGRYGTAGCTPWRAGVGAVRVTSVWAGRAVRILRAGATAGGTRSAGSDGKAQVGVDLPVAVDRLSV